jgi:hypothetical protein
MHAQMLCEESKVKLVLGEFGGGYVKPNPNAEMHESLTGAWYAAEVISKRHYNWTTGKEDRRMNLCRRRTIPPRSLIHGSAYERGGDYIRKLPSDAMRVT